MYTFRAILDIFPEDDIESIFTLYGRECKSKSRRLILTVTSTLNEYLNVMRVTRNRLKSFSLLRKCIQLGYTMSLM